MKTLMRYCFIHTRTALLLFVLLVFSCDRNGEERGASAEGTETSAEEQVLERSGSQQAFQIQVENQSVNIQAGDRDVKRTPVLVPWEGEVPECLETAGTAIPVQAETDSEDTTWLWIPVELSAGENRSYQPASGSCPGRSFQWEAAGSDKRQLVSEDVPLLEYVHPVYDSGNLEETKKPFHHIFSPGGSRFLTKGPGGLYSHHRGVFFGYNRVLKGGEELDIWHAEHGERPEHEQVRQEWNGPVFGGHEVVIAWKDKEGRAFAEETRQVRVFPRSEVELLVDVSISLRSLGGRLELNGDHHHAGIQFRAAQEVSENRNLSMFVRPEPWRQKSPDEEVDDPDYIDLPWNAFRFGLDEDIYTVGYLSHPKNPAGAEMSERLYGRFGEFIPAVIDTDQPLRLHYRFVIDRGQLPDREDLEQEHRVYSNDNIFSLSILSD